eukprot:TRINITY_DN66745_c0_g1_i1.p1 TRINITY_DN66745_c0_g1~~TRINITY_DN66745_c0_g1_i1.p1  ORF type:complete len:150 (+),score=10.71 TRINITY_DN66745_c0_g1_i1:20-469(+)
MASQQEDEGPKPFCNRCKNQIEYTAINVSGTQNFYCLECFLCTGCNNPLSTRRYKQKDGLPYCSLSCAGLPPEPKYYCKSCDKRIFSSKMTLEPSNDDEQPVHFHPRCFNCFGCKQNLSLKTHYGIDSEVYCPECYKQQLDIVFDQFGR